MLFGVAVVATSIIVSAIIAVVIGSIYEALVDRSWPTALPPSAVAVVVLSVATGYLLGSALG